MLVVKVVFLLLTGIGISLCDVEYDEYIKHFTTWKQFTCGSPQPRAFLIEEVITADFVKDKRENIQPPATVLHRCFSSGCCKKRGQRCMPTAMETVTLRFARSHSDEIQTFNVQAVNHTQCGCMEVDNV